MDRSNLELLAVFFSAFGGALAALLVQWVKAYRDDLNEAVAAGNRALVAIGDQLDSLVRIRDQHLAPLQGAGDRHIHLGAFHVPPIGATIPFDRLAFLLRGDPPRADLFQQPILSSKATDTAFRLLRIRTDFLLHEVQPRVAAILDNEPELDTIPVGLVEQVLGPWRVGTLRSHTDNLYDAVAGAIGLSESAFRALRRGLSERFPTFSIMNLALRVIERPRRS